MIFPSRMGNGMQALRAGLTGWEVVAACYDVAFCYSELIDLTQIAVSLAENILVFPLKLEIVPVIMNWYVNFLLWNVAAVSVNAVVLVALLLRSHILHCCPYWGLCWHGHHQSNLSDSGYLRFSWKANLSQIKLLKVSIQIINHSVSFPA